MSLHESTRDEKKPTFGERGLQGPLVSSGYDAAMAEASPQIERSKLEELAAAGKVAPPIIKLEETDALLPRHWTAGSNKYCDFEDLTAGGTATLQTCFDQNLHRFVVYKTLHEDLRDDETETKRFLREARVTSMIAHPGTVPVYELGRDVSGALYFTMKRLQGRNLRNVIEHLSAKDRDVAEEYPLPSLIDVLISVCQTVAYAHTQGVIHRDLKPANVLIGAFGEVTVLDWGLAKVRGEKISVAVDLPDAAQELREGMLGDERPLLRSQPEPQEVPEDLSLTRPGKRYGTPLYMSPEQARGDEVDERTDVFNVGSILYEMLALKNLVWGQTVEEVLEQVLERPTPKPSDEAPWWREVPDELEAICLKALEKDPAGRYASMEDLAEDLIAYRANEPVSAARYGWFTRLRRWQQQHRSSVAVAGAFLAGAGLVALAWWVLG